MQEEKYHRSFGRGYNASCNNYNCSNYGKKIGRTRSGWYSRDITCPICRQFGYLHSYTCKVGKDGMMMCDCNLRVSELKGEKCLQIIQW